MDSDQHRTTIPGLEPGGGVPPGETPPAEGSTPASLTDRTADNRASDVNPSRAPAVVTIIALSLMVVGVLVYVVFSIIGHLRG